MVGEAFDGRTSAIAFGSQRVLAGIGLWHGVAAEAEPIREIRVADGDSPLFLHYDHRRARRPIRSAISSRTACCAAPSSPARGRCRRCAISRRRRPRVEREPRRHRHARRRHAACAARCSRPPTARDSPLRRAAGIRTIEWSYPQTAIVCTVSARAAASGIAVEHFLPAGPFAILPMTGDRSSIVWTERAELAPRLLALDAADFHAELRARFGDFLGRARGGGAALELSARR